MHLMGIDHERLTFKYQGRRFRLTDVHGQVGRRFWYEQTSDDSKDPLLAIEPDVWSVCGFVIFRIT